MAFFDEKRYKNSSETEEDQSYWYKQVLSLNKVIFDIIARIGFLVFVYCWKGI